MKIFHLSITFWLIYSSVAIAEVPKFKKIENFNLRFRVGVDIPVQMLAYLSGLNMKTTESAQEKLVRLNLKNLDTLQVIEEICKGSGLAYQYDKQNKIFTFMTQEEYLTSLPLSMNQQFKTFKVSPENLETIPTILEQSFPGKVFTSEGAEIKEFPVEEGEEQSSSTVSSPGNLGEITEQTWLDGIKLSVKKILEIERKKIFSKDKDTKIDYTDLVNQSRLNLPPVIITANNEHSLLVVRTFGQNSMDFVEEFIKEHNKTAPQVLLEMKILELQIGDDFKSSFDYTIKNVTNGSNIELGDPTRIVGDASFSYELISDTIDAKIQLLKKNNQLEVLATPIILAANNRAAEFQVTDEDLLLSGFSVGTRNITDPSGAVRQESFSIPDYEEEDIGLTLKILPTIIDEKRIILAVEQESSDKKEAASTIEFLVGDNLESRAIDIKSERTIKSTVIAHDGKSIAIGGLVRTQNKTELDKVPLLGDIPLLGYFFRSEITKNVKTELVLLITPHIIQADEAELIKSKELLKRISDHNFHEGGQKAVDEKVKDLEDYKKPRNNKIGDFIKDPEEVLVPSVND